MTAIPVPADAQTADAEADVRWPAEFYATPVDAGEYGVAGKDAPAPIRGRITADGSSGFPAAPGRYHLYAGWFCPWSHRALIVRDLLGLQDVVTVAYVDGLRDGRGWAFRPATGPDPVNGFTLLREAYLATDPAFSGAASLPAMWDRVTSRVVSNDPASIDTDLATAFAAWATPNMDLYPQPRRAQIDHHEAWLRASATTRLAMAVYNQNARDELLATFGQLDTTFTRRDYLVGDTLTLADIRLWVSLVRYDAGANAHGAVGPKLPTFEHLWNYACRLYAIPAFQRTTRIKTFAAPYADLPDWNTDHPGGG